MASITQRQFAGKQLGELLQCQQEPFTLEVYLLERGYLNSRMFLKTINKRKRRRVVIPSCSKIVRAVLNTLISVSLKMKNPERGDEDIGVTKRRPENAEEILSSDSSATVKFPWGCLEDNKQLSPVSVLEATLSDETSPLHHTQHNVKTNQEETSTISNSITTKKAIHNLPDSSSIEKQNCTGVSSDLSSQYKKIKMALQQTKQLLFDCVKEMVESHRTSQQQFREFLGAEEIGKLLSENIWAWSKQAIDGTKLNLDLSASAEEWSDFEQQRKEIAMEIGDLIFEDICNEIVTDMVT